MVAYLGRITEDGRLPLAKASEIRSRSIEAALAHAKHQEDGKVGAGGDQDRRQCHPQTYSESANVIKKKKESKPECVVPEAVDTDAF